MIVARLYVIFFVSRDIIQARRPRHSAERLTQSKGFEFGIGNKIYLAKSSYFIGIGFFHDICKYVEGLYL